LKVVLFCGGLGTRIREDAESIPKPMVVIGYRPIVWHLMKYYAHFGHRDFILCLGYRADVVKNYFLRYDECLTNDFVISEGAKKVNLLASDIHDWRITCVDTGLNSNVGQRLKAVEKHLEGEDEFLANYSDGLTDLDLNAQIDDFHRHKKVASFLSVKPNVTFHFVSTDADNLVTGIRDIDHSDMRINGGFFVFKKKIFEYLRPGEELVNEPFQRLIQERNLIAYRYEGFWTCMDTFKDKQRLESMYSKGEALWEVWKEEAEHPGLPPHAPVAGRMGP
jgi:glucose-1-phosphate cytidylyltransferase